MATSHALGVLNKFKGRWGVGRRITDPDGKEKATLEGIAEFTSYNSGLRYTEKGELRLDTGAVLVAERCYFWWSEGDKINIAFQDGRPFHSFTYETPSATHFCTPDTYQVTYEFDHWPVWHSSWHVIGPSKVYISKTTYNPLK